MDIFPHEAPQKIFYQPIFGENVFCDTNSRAEYKQHIYYD